mmetsp:Transcript_27560/g.38048  ORF Transcript_27560/g.38048 Transcript_27560/m.38048 type:complete len:230 (-) Transcript_27560:435-1124(-)
MGFSSKSSNPISKHSCQNNCEVVADIPIMILTVGKTPWDSIFLICRVAVIPSMFGISRSMKMASNLRPSHNNFRHSSPSEAQVHARPPCLLSVAARSLRHRMLSSTTSTLRETEEDLDNSAARKEPETELLESWNISSLVSFSLSASCVPAPDSFAIFASAESPEDGLLSNPITCGVESHVFGALSSRASLTSSLTWFTNPSAKGSLELKSPYHDCLVGFLRACSLSAA